jgi:hypothetical protein
MPHEGLNIQISINSSTLNANKLKEKNVRKIKNISKKSTI